MTIPHILVIISAAISVTGASFYIRDTLQGKTKPNRVTWLMWGISSSIATFAAFSLHADPWGTTRVFLAGFLPLVVFSISFVNPKSYWKLTNFDIACGIFSAIALILWLVVDLPRVSILLAIVADASVCLPSFLKLWRYPETETRIVYIANFITVILILPSIPVWNIENSAYQIYLLAVNGLLLFAVYQKTLKSVFLR